MNSIKKRLLFIVFTSFLIIPTTSFATGLVTPGSEWAQNGGTASIGANAGFWMHLDANRSYSCTGIGQDTSTELSLSSSVTEPSGDTITAEERGDVTPVVTAQGDSTGTADNRLSITAEESGEHLFVANSDVSGGETARLVCVETTLYALFNTNVNDFNFLEITNISNSTIEGRWRAIDFSGTEHTDTFSIPANRRVDVDLHSVVGQDLFGHVIVTHNGPTGSLIGGVSQYAGIVSDFELQTTSPLRSRSQENL